MLDSTGSRVNRDIYCFICCENKLSFVVYTPKYGHAGEELNVGSCIEDDTLKNHEGSRFFEIRPYIELPNDAERDGFMPVVFKGSWLQRSIWEPYHYCDYHVPDFGWAIGQTIWVCNVCAKVQEEEILLRKLSESFYLKTSQRLERLIYRLFSRGIIDIVPTAKTKFRHIRKEEKRDFMEMLAILQDVNQTSLVKLAYRKLKQVQKAVE